MSNDPLRATQISVADLRPGRPTGFLIEPDGQTRAALAETLGADGIRKLRFSGEISPYGRNGWAVSGTLGATILQSCVISLAPVTTRLDLTATRIFQPAYLLEEYEPGSETEISTEDDPEPLGSEIDLLALAAEELSLALPAYPRAEGVALEKTQFADADVAPLTDADLKPFAGLAGLREKMRKDGEES